MARFVLLRARLWQSIQPADRISKEMLQNSIRQQVNLANNLRSVLPEKLTRLRGSPPLWRVAVLGCRWPKQRRQLLGQALYFGRDGGIYQLDALLPTDDLKLSILSLRLQNLPFPMFRPFRLQRWPCGRNRRHDQK